MVYSLGRIKQMTLSNHSNVPKYNRTSLTDYTDRSLTCLADVKQVIQQSLILMISK